MTPNTSHLLMERQADSDLAAALVDTLSRHPGSDAGGITVFVSQGEVLLTGVVASVFSAQYALELAEEAAEGHTVLSALRVAPGSAHRYAPSITPPSSHLHWS